MRVKIQRAMAAPAFHYKPGQIIDLPAERAKRLIAKGLAVKLKGQPADELEPEADAEETTATNAGEQGGTNDDATPRETTETAGKPVRRRPAGRAVKPAADAAVNPEPTEPQPTE